MGSHQVPNVLPWAWANMGRALCKTYGITTRCYWEHPWGTHWELEGNKEKMKKNPPPPQPQNSKEKKSRHFESMLSLPIGCITPH